MKNNSIKTIVATGIGAALFVVIGMVNIPLFANTSVQLQYAVQALLSIIFGPVAGFLIGFIGHAVKDMMSPYGVWWTWVIPSGLFGLGIGFLHQKLNIDKGVLTTKDIIFFNIAQIAINAVVWGLVAPTGDVLVYQQPSELVYAQGIISGVANALTVGVGGTILLAVYAKSRVQTGSLSKD